MIDDPDRCYAALCARDPRFDGWFTFGVTTTGIHCRPSCPARTPARANVRFFGTSAAAVAAGFRACRRCRPDASPGSPAWDHRADVVARAVRAIADGEVDRHGVAGLADRLGYSPRHLHRQLVTELGVGPRELARTQRAHTARTLIERTALPFTDVAAAAGFGSLRQFNATVRAHYAASPTQLRAAARRRDRDGSARRTDATAPAGTVSLRLATRPPFAGDALLRHLAARAVPGLEEHGPGWHRRALTLPGGGAVVTLTPGVDGVALELLLDDPTDLAAAVARLRRMLDLDADPLATDRDLGADPVLAALVAATPGLRCPAAPDPIEACLRVVLGQQVSVAGAATLAARVVARCGVPLDHPVGGVTHRLPDASVVAAADLRDLGLPAARAATLRRLAAAVADGTLDLGPGADRSRARATLAATAGVGPWTTDVLALRGLRDPDAFPASDLVVRRTAAALGLPDGPSALAAASRRWRPWRAHAAQHLWHHAACDGLRPAVAPRDVPAPSSDAPPRPVPPTRRVVAVATTTRTASTP